MKQEISPKILQASKDQYDNTMNNATHIGLTTEMKRTNFLKSINYYNFYLTAK
jgi:hypothetical protein